VCVVGFVCVGRGGRCELRVLGLELCVCVRALCVWDGVLRVLCMLCVLMLCTVCVAVCGCVWLCVCVVCVRCVRVRVSFSVCVCVKCVRVFYGLASLVSCAVCVLHVRVLRILWVYLYVCILSHVFIMFCIMSFVTS
jgi:hypothetical protein